MTRIKIRTNRLPDVTDTREDGNQGGNPHWFRQQAFGTCHIVADLYRYQTGDRGYEEANKQQVTYTWVPLLL